MEVFHITDSANRASASGGLDSSGQIPTSGGYNVSLTLPSEDLAVLADGAGSLHVISTGQRQEGAKWKVSNCVCTVVVIVIFLIPWHVILNIRFHIWIQSCAL